SSDQQETRSTRARRHNRRHSLALHRGSLLDLAELFKSSQDFVHDPTAFIDVGKLSATEKHVYQNFVFLLKEFLGPLDLYFDIVCRLLLENKNTVYDSVLLDLTRYIRPLPLP